MKTVIGIDVGGTKIDFVQISLQGDLLQTYRLPTQAYEGVESVLVRLIQGICHLVESSSLPIIGIGIGLPGQVDPVKGKVNQAVNLGWEDVELVKQLQARLPIQLPIYIDNDVNMAALGEYHFGAAQQIEDFVYLALGTGLGSAAMCNGQLIRGYNSFAMEIGHLALVDHGRVCHCGLRGCLEMYTSGESVSVALKEHQQKFPESPPLSKYNLLSAAQADDPLASYVLSEVGNWLGVTMALCSSLLNPSLIIIGGGFGKTFSDYILPTAQTVYKQRILPLAQAPIQLAEVEYIAVGAACLALSG